LLIAARQRMASVTVYYDDGQSHDTIEVAGEFNNWAPSAMSKIGSTYWEQTISGLEADRTYMYKFVVDGEWKLQPGEGDIVSDAAGNQNHAVVAKKDVIVEHGSTENDNIQGTDTQTTEPSGVEESNKARNVAGTAAVGADVVAATAVSSKPATSAEEPSAAEQAAPKTPVSRFTEDIDESKVKSDVAVVNGGIPPPTQLEERQVHATPPTVSTGTAPASTATPTADGAAVGLGVQHTLAEQPVVVTDRSPKGYQVKDGKFEQVQIPQGPSSPTREKSQAKAEVPRISKSAEPKPQHVISDSASPKQATKTIPHLESATQPLNVTPRAAAAAAAIPKTTQALKVAPESAPVTMPPKSPARGTAREQPANQPAVQAATKSTPTAPTSDVAVTKETLEPVTAAPPAAAAAAAAASKPQPAAAPVTTTQPSTKATPVTTTPKPAGGMTAQAELSTGQKSVPATTAASQANPPTVARNNAEPRPAAPSSALPSPSPKKRGFFSRLFKR
jgi:hypothetical protein